MKRSGRQSMRNLLALLAWTALYGGSPVHTAERIVVGRSRIQEMTHTDGPVE